MLTVTDYPCRECNERRVGCHSDCNRYKDSVDKENLKKSAIYEAKKKEGIVSKFEVESTLKNRRGDRKKRNGVQR